MNMNPFAKVELLFWDFTIRLLSHPGFTRILLRKGDWRVDAAALLPIAFWFALAGTAGLVSGYLFYFLTAGAR